MEIRRLTSTQEDAAVALWHDAGLVVPWNEPRADLERALAGPSSTVLAATENGALLGTAMVGHDGHRGWVYYLAVAASCRGHGVGRALMRTCERWLVQRGVPKINLMVRGSNDAVQGFYDAVGYGRDDVVVRSRRLG
jgi:ribosomal protein S18 acetylase RimI-like enzyme